MDIIGLFLLAAVIGLGWWSAVGARARARSAARRACRQAEVTFIDELAFQRLRLARGVAGSLCLKRTYHFEFVVRGDLRYTGNVFMEGQHVVSVDMDPYPFEPATHDTLDRR